jgi:hypothetical protein
VYDATTAATVTITLDGVITGDTVDGSATGEFADKNVGNDKEVLLGPVMLSGADAANYMVSPAPANPTANITPRQR